jgi:glycosyltransferase involved in cell wall biosynthesis
MKAVREQHSIENPLVSVVMITYNHETFVAQAIESVLMQVTDFTVELVIGEDCSTDGTRGILVELQAEYPNVLRLLDSNRNLGANFNGRRTLVAARGKYIALLEGDDFWTDIHKLAGQVELMESRGECSLCFHPVKVLNAVTGNDEQEYPAAELRVSLQGPESLVEMGNFIPTCSVMARQTALAVLPSSFDGLVMGDWPTWLLTSLNGSVACIDRVMGCYRVHNGGVWSRLSQFRRLTSETDMWELLIPLLPAEISRLARERLIINYLTLLSHSEQIGFWKRTTLSVKWLSSSFIQGTLSRPGCGFVLGKAFPTLLKLRRKR